MLTRFTITLLLVFLPSLILSSAMADSFAPIVVPWLQERAGQTEEPPKTVKDSFPVRQVHQQQPSQAMQPHSFDTVRQTVRTLSAQIEMEPAEGPSRLEKIYSDRIIDELEQFGYDLFGVPKPETRGKLEHMASAPLGAVQEDFVLNTGDKLEVVFSGQRTDREIYAITSQGLLLITDFPPIPAAGRTIGQVRLSVNAAAQNLHNTQAYVSLSEVSQIGVLIVGHVKRPGRQNLTVFHTVLDALMEAGGIERTGSLRQIKLVRHGRNQIIDLYGLLIHGAANMDFRLRDGDRIIVPPLGPTVAIAGEVKRPGIYEILPDLSGMRHRAQAASEQLSLNDMLEFAGGVLAPGKNRFLKLSITHDGQEQVEEAASENSGVFTPQFGDGAILMVSKGAEKRTGMVELAGHTRRPGLYAQSEMPTLQKLIDSEKVLGENIYPLIGILERHDTETFSRTLHSFPVQLVLKGAYDRKLEDGDVVRLFSNQQIAALKDKDNEAVKESESAKELDMGSRGQDDEDDSEARLNDPVLVSFLEERYAFIRGAIRLPGRYPVSEATTLDSLLAVAGGLTLEANTANIEITASRGANTPRRRINFRETNPKNVEIAAGDAVRINQKFKKVADESVLIIGEVRHPGRYDLLPGDKMSDLLERAGGLTSQAYAEGAIFSRESERAGEEARFRAAARDLERSVAEASEKQEDGPNIDQLSIARKLAAELREVEAVGRITVESDPAILATEPELDILLEKGDRIYIPKRPLTVKVRGEILSPASLQFRTSKKPLDYIHEAGGFTYNADKERTFVLYPDGSSQPLQVSSWNYKPVFIPPGSTIIVPRDPKPFDFIESARDITQILSNLAITGVFIADIRDDD